MFDINTSVFVVDFGRREKFITCPDCLGSRSVKVILGNGTEVTIECGGCDPGGYQPSTGYVKQYEWSAGYKKATVTGVSNSIHGVTYELDNFGGSSYRTGSDETVFATMEEAIAASVLLAAEHEVEENKRLLAKTKAHKSWAWNYSYHLRCIKDLEAQLAYHHAKAKVCEAHKTEVATST